MAEAMDPQHPEAEKAKDLSALFLKGWKSFYAGAPTPLLLGPLTLLVGPNGSGKSNVLDALRFLQGAALDLPLAEVLRGRWEGGREVWPPIRGQVAEAPSTPGGDFLVGTAWGCEPPPTSPWVHTLHVACTGDVTCSAEHLQLPPNGPTPFSTLAPGHGPRAGAAISAELWSTGPGRPEVGVYNATRAVLGQVQPLQRTHPEVMPAVRRVQRALREILFLDLRPERMRDYRPESASTLGASGEAISPVLWRMSEDEQAAVLEWVSELCGPILALDFEHTRLGDVMFSLEEPSDRLISARSVSDGTLRFLGLVVALLTAEPGSLIVLEAPDLGLHPSRIHLLAQLLQQVTKGGRVQILATTHSPFLLAHLDEENLANVVALDRDPTTGASVATRLGELPHFDTLRDSDHLAELISNGFIERDR